MHKDIWSWVFRTPYLAGSLEGGVQKLSLHSPTYEVYNKNIYFFIIKIMSLVTWF